MAHHNIKLPELFKDRTVQHACMRTAQQNRQIRFAALEDRGDIDRKNKTAPQRGEAHYTRTPGEQVRSHPFIERGIVLQFSPFQQSLGVIDLDGMMG